MKVVDFVMLYEHSDNYLVHYGVKGQKHGIRRFQNEDGSLTAEGRDHYGVGEAIRGAGQRIKSGVDSVKQRAHDFKVRAKKFGESSAQALGLKPKKLTPEQKKQQDAKKKKLIAAAAGITIAAIGAGVALNRYNKASDNMIQLAKNHIHDKYEMSKKSATSDAQRRAADSWKQKEMSQVTDRYAAKKVLGIKGYRQTRQFIRDNKLGTRSTSELIERRMGHIVEGHHRNRLTGKWEPYSEKKRRKVAERMARRGIVG